MPSDLSPRRLRLIRPQDLVWLLLFAVLAEHCQIGDVFEIGPLALLAVVQILEPKIPALASTRGRILWIVLKLVLGYVLIGYTGGIESEYWPVLLLPVVTAATVLGFAGTLAFILLAGGAYLSYWGFVANCRPGRGTSWKCWCGWSSWRWGAF